MIPITDDDLQWLIMGALSDLETGFDSLIVDALLKDPVIGTLLRRDAPEELRWHIEARGPKGTS